MLLTKSIRLTNCSPANCLDCFENLKVKEFGLITLAEKYFEKYLKDPLLHFQELTRIDKAVSAQLTVQFVHMGQGS